MDDVIKEARDRWCRDKDAWKDVYARAREDQHFLSDDAYAQWDRRDYDSRVTTGRPAITIDQLTQFVHQVANDIRMNTPSINIIPSTGGDVDTAEIFKGIIRNIEYASNADDAYDTAVLNSIKSSIGFIRVDHDFSDDLGFEQNLVIRRVNNPLSCWIDADSIECDGSDAKHGTVIDRISLSQFKRLYPGHDPVSFDGEQVYGKEDHVLVAEQFFLEEEQKEIALLPDGSVVEYQKGIEFSAKRTIKKIKVKRLKMTGADVIGETYFPGRYVPLVPVYGEEAWIEGKRHLYSLIRKSKEAQRMFNYWKSLETELLQKQPQAPIMAAYGQVEDFKDDWTNPAKSMVLRYKTIDAEGNPVGAPQRLEPPTVPTGFINAARGAVDDIKATMGMYNASLGQRSNEQSGVAIAQRKQEGDVATYHFGDNLVRSITQVGRILVNAAPEIYDTPRVIRMIDGEDNPKEIGINGAMAAEQEKTFDLNKGKYDVKVVTGAPFTTRRQEAAEFFTQIISKNPELISVMGDLMFKNMDFAGAQQMAERMKKIIDPKFLEEGEAEEDPEKQQMTEIIKQLQEQLVMAQQEAQSKSADVQIKAMDAKLKEGELALKAKELEVKEGELLAKTEIEQRKIEADVFKARLDAKTKVSGDLALMDPEISEGGQVISQLMQVFGDGLATIAATQEAGFQNMAMMQAESNQSIISAITAPKRTQIIRDSEGRISAGVSTIQ